MKLRLVLRYRAKAARASRLFASQSIGVPLLLSFLAVAEAREAAAQATSISDEVFVNSEIEHYLRVLQGRGLVAAHPWSVRSFSPAEVRKLLPTDTAHPWANRFPVLPAASSIASETDSAARDLTAPPADASSPPAGLASIEPNTDSGVKLRWIAPEARLIHNTGFPFGSNDGPLWAGRGVTASVQAGFALNAGPISLEVAPIAFWSQNADFELADNGLTDRLRFADGSHPDVIDQPQRFGNRSFSRIDPGRSTLRADLLGIELGISTANQHWGPARDFPLLLGNNAPGFPNAFVGPSSPLNIGIGRLQARLVAGRLTQSDYATLGGDSVNRLMTGLVVGFSPRPVPGMEIGIGRFSHELWPTSGVTVSDLLSPLESVYAADTENSSGNQIASLFLRWAFPSSGLELYGEYVRDDWTWGLRDLMLFPDQNAGYLIGLQKSWVRSNRNWVIFRTEVTNARTGPNSPAGYSDPLYIHYRTRQGHTQGGQILSSPVVFRGAGSILAVDSYRPSGRWTIEWTRSVRQDFAELARGAVQGADAIHSLGVQRLFSRSKFDVSAGLTAVYNFDRYLRDDAFNLRTSLSMRARL